ncbi:MAG: tetratricopeptide repeat protein [Chloroflexi bacterium]|nr:tetratricopeptide repeat protein [Chloroflexota bacterium]
MKRLRSEKAIQFAMQNKWHEAADTNRQILEHFPEDVDTLNRLGKALLELGQYVESRDAYKKASEADPSNSIAAKNLARLTRLVEESHAARVAVAPTAPARRVDPSLFIEESGKTAVTELVDVARYQDIAALTAGDGLELRVEDGRVRVFEESGAQVGVLEPKIAQRVMRLLSTGNRYSAAITSIDEGHIRIIVREEYRDPSMRNRPSFPTQAAEVRAYTRESVFRTDMDEEDEDMMEDAEPDAETADVAEADMDATPSSDENDANDEP